MKAEKVKKSDKKIPHSELILQFAGEGICGIDLKGKISFANPASLKMFGWQDAEIIGGNYNQIFFQRSADKFDEIEVCPINFCLMYGETSHVHTETFYRSDNSQFLVEYVCVPLIEHDEIVGAVITFQDITERRELESAVAEARDSALQTANLKTNFLANMSHEIRTPLNGIIGMTELLLDTNLSKEQLHYSQTVKKSAELLLEIVNDILDFSKIEAGKLKLEQVKFDLQDLIAETCEFFKVQVEKRRINLSYSLEKNYSLFGDVIRLKQIFNNLISNAIKFTTQGEIKIIAENIAENKFLFSVSDTGMGMSEKQQPYLFQPFTQADASTSRRFGGTGLGLTICKQLVELMNGEIGVESEIGKGSKFWFTVELNQDEKKSDEKKVDENSFEIANLPEIKILVADDNVINQQVALGSLRAIGYQAESVSSGIQALSLVKKADYDLILMDCQMPEIDGYETTKQIRDLENIKQPKIIAMTAHIGDNERRKCLQSGMDDYLSKPFTKKQLAEIISKNFPQDIEKNLDSKENIGQDSIKDLFEPETLKNLLEIESRGEENFTSDLIRLYFSNAEKHIAEIEKARLEQNKETLRKSAHALKGSSGSIGLKKMYQNSADLESISSLVDWQIIEKQVDLLLQTFIETKILIERNLGDLSK
jgi:PAS domain S-box-containing protein